MKTRCVYATRIQIATRRITHAVDSYSRKLRSIYDLTVPQLTALQCVAEDGPLTASEISKKIHLSASTLVGVLDRLEGKTLITRSRTDMDRRKVIVMTTTKGKELADDAPSPMEDILSARLQDLPEREKALLAEGVEKLVKLLDN